MIAWSGVFHVMATPFTDGGDLHADGLPRLALKAIRDHFVAGRRDDARALFYRWLPLIRYESQPGSTPGTAVGIRKEILRRRGWIDSPRVRPPAPALDAGTLNELGEILRAVGA